MRYWMPMRLAWSETLMGAGRTEALLTVRFGLDTVEATRARIPTLGDRWQEFD